MNQYPPLSSSKHPPSNHAAAASSSHLQVSVVIDLLFNNEKEFCNIMKKISEEYEKLHSVYIDVHQKKLIIVGDNLDVAKIIFKLQKKTRAELTHFVAGNASFHFLTMAMAYFKRRFALMKLRIGLK